MPISCEQIRHHALVASAGDPLAWDYPVESLHDVIGVITHLWTEMENAEDDYENTSTVQFLQAMAAWLSSFPQSYMNTGQAIPDPDWRFLADVLRAAATYE